MGNNSMTRWIYIGITLAVLGTGTAFLYPVSLEKASEFEFVSQFEERDILDLSAANYLPNEAHRRFIGYPRCGTSLLMREAEYIENHGRMISEQALIERARKLLANHAPGEQFALLPCRSEGCAGIVPVGMLIRAY
jgi:hypothetical protein